MSRNAVNRFAAPLVLASGVCLGMFLASRWIGQRSEKGTMCQCRPRLEGKVVVITGATSGIGYQVALECAKRRARVIFGARNIDRGMEIAGQITALTGNEDVTALYLDLNDLKSCKDFAIEVLNKEPVVSFLVNNAGIFHQKPVLTNDGFEHTWQTNYLGAVVVVENLLGNIGVGEVGSKGIIFVTSAARKMVSAKDALEGFEDRVKLTPVLTTFEENARHYALTKQAQWLYCTFLAHSQGSVPDCTVVSVDPGSVWTNIFRDCFRNGLSGLFKRFQCSLLMRTPLEGAQTVLHCMQAPSVQNGVCMKDCTIDCRPSKEEFENCPSFVAKTHRLVSAYMPDEPTQQGEADEQKPGTGRRRSGGLW